MRLLQYWNRLAARAAAQAGNSFPRSWFRNSLNIFMSLACPPRFPEVLPASTRSLALKMLCAPLFTFEKKSVSFFVFLPLQ
jgi:hypothetical protein